MERLSDSLSMLYGLEGFADSYDDKSADLSQNYITPAAAYFAGSSQDELSNKTPSSIDWAPLQQRFSNGGDGYAPHNQSGAHIRTVPKSAWASTPYVLGRSQHEDANDRRTQLIDSAVREGKKTAEVSSSRACDFTIAAHVLHKTPSDAGSGRDSARTRPLKGSWNLAPHYGELRCWPATFKPSLTDLTSYFPEFSHADELAQLARAVWITAKRVCTICSAADPIPTMTTRTNKCANPRILRRVTTAMSPSEKLQHLNSRSEDLIVIGQATYAISDSKARGNNSVQETNVSRASSKMMAGEGSDQLWHQSQVASNSLTGGAEVSILLQFIYRLLRYESLRRTERQESREGNENFAFGDDYAKGRKDVNLESAVTTLAASLSSLSTAHRKHNEIKRLGGQSCFLFDCCTQPGFCWKMKVQEGNESNIAAAEDDRENVSRIQMVCSRLFQDIRSHGRGIQQLVTGSSANPTGVSSSSSPFEGSMRGEGNRAAPSRQNARENGSVPVDRNTSGEVYSTERIMERNYGYSCVSRKAVNDIRKANPVNGGANIPSVANDKTPAHTANNPQQHLQKGGPDVSTVSGSRLASSTGTSIGVHNIEYTTITKIRDFCEGVKECTVKSFEDGALGRRSRTMKFSVTNDSTCVENSADWSKMVNVRDCGAILEILRTFTFAVFIGSA